MGDVDDRIPPLPAPAVQALRVEGLPPCTIQAMADGTWHVTTQLVRDEAAALAAAALAATALPPDVLCQRAQHALGLAGIGSRIAPDRQAIGVYIPTSPAPFGATPLILAGRSVLWAVSRAPSEAIRALIAAATQVIRQSPSA
jgi:hypothetical protein